MICCVIRYYMQNIYILLLLLAAEAWDFDGFFLC